MNFGEDRKVFSVQGGLGIMALMFWLAINIPALAQDVQQISGRIINVETQAPIPFASVGIPPPPHRAGC